MLALASDYVGCELKQKIMAYLDEKQVPYIDFGSTDLAVSDYPVYALKAAKAVQSGECARGILFCGTGVGISIAANKVRGIRCVCCSEPYSALMAREHNDANMLALGTRVVGGELAKMIVDQWLGGEFLGGIHAERVAMITKIEQTGDL